MSLVVHKLIVSSKEGTLVTERPSNNDRLSGLVDENGFWIDLVCTHKAKYSVKIAWPRASITKLHRHNTSPVISISRKCPSTNNIQLTVHSKVCSHYICAFKSGIGNAYFPDPHSSFGDNGESGLSFSNVLVDSERNHLYFGYIVGLSSRRAWAEAYLPIRASNSGLLLVLLMS